MARLTVLPTGKGWDWICGTPSQNFSSDNPSCDDTQNTTCTPWEQVRVDSCFPNFLLLIPHFIFFFIYPTVVAIIVIHRKFYRRDSIARILDRYPGHKLRWILNLLYTVLLLFGIGESSLSDIKLEGLPQPHLYLPAIFAFLTGIMSIVYYHMMELLKKPRMVYGLLLYWLVVLTLEAYRLANWVQNKPVQVKDVIVLRFDIMVLSLLAYGIYIILDCIVIIKKVFRRLISAPKRGDRDNFEMKYQQKYVSLFSTATFWWLNWLFILGYRFPLEMKDLGCLPSKFTSKYNRSLFNLFVRREKARVEDDDSKMSLYRVFWRLCKKPLLYAGVLRFFADTLGFVGPMAVNALVQYATALQDADAEDDSDTYSEYVTVHEFIKNGFILVFIMFVSSFLRFLCLQNHYHIVIVESLHIRAAIQTAVYDKSLRLSSWTLSGGDMTIGAVINHMSTDPENLMNMIQYTHYIWAIPYQIGGTVLLLYYNLNEAALVGFSIFGLLIPLQFCMASVLARVEKNILRYSDTRLKRTNEVLQGIKMVKVQALEDVFFKYINVIRIKELWQMVIGALFTGLLYFTQNACPIVVTLVSFTLYSKMTDQVLTPNTAFSTLALVNQITLPITIIPMVVSFFVSGHISTQRLRRFLLAQEINPVDTGRTLTHEDDEEDEDDEYETTSVDSRPTASIQTASGSSYDLPRPISSRDSAILVDGDELADVGSLSEQLTPERFVRNVPNLPQNVALKILNGCYTWDPVSPVPILHDITTQISTAKLTMIVGKVGSGKSSLLSACLGEMTRKKGFIIWNNHLRPKMAYCPQTAWLLNRSLEKNITFGRERHERRYQEVIQACALQPDIDILPDGDQSMIGEKGINLSGGQKQRVSIARAIYSDCDVVIMDDPLSSLDVHVGHHVFHQAIMGLLVKKGRTVILVTHQLQYLQYADKVIVMKSGGIDCQGTPQQVAQSDPDLDTTWKLALEHTAHAFKKHVDDDEEEEEEEEDQNTAEKERRELAAYCLLNKDLREVKLEEQNDKKRKDDARDRSGRVSWKEEREFGTVSKHVYRWYAKMMQWPLVFVIVVSMMIQSGLSIGTNFWLSDWSSVGLNATNASDPDTIELTQHYITGYTGLAVSSIIMSLISAIVINIATLVASKIMHEDMLENTLHLPTMFFDNTPVGRIINKFSSDLHTVDRQLAETLMWVIVAILNCLSALLVNAIVAPIFMAFVLPVILGFFVLQRFFIKTSIELKRLDSIAKSPIYALFGETLNGLPTVRSYRCHFKFRKELFVRIDKSVLTNLYLQSANRWLGVRLDFTGAAFVLISGLTSLTVATIGELDPGYVGLAVTYALSSSMWLNWLIRNSSDCEIQMNAAERIRGSINAPREAYEGFKDPPGSWPTEGEITYSNIDVRYGSDYPLILKGINLKFRGGEKIGIVGRTGSGKTSLVSLLFRLVEQMKGSVTIDGVHTNLVPLKKLRRVMAIIPQDPILFSGTIRFNLDPRAKKSDNELWRSLEMAQLKEFVKESTDALDSDVTEGGQNLSFGQRQLICLARAFLQDTRVVIMDEATSSIDMQTDAVLQKAVHTAFKQKTVITIAHRISTVKDYDRILVLEEGQIKEYDTPENLLQDPNSTFSQMVKAGK